MKSIFVGSNGIRAGWRLLIFIAIVAAILAAFGLSIHFLLNNLLHHHYVPSKTTLSPGAALQEAVLLIALIPAALIMAKIEGRPFSSYGLPWRGIFQQKLALGLVFGFAAISCVLLAIFALHGFTITGVSTDGDALLVSIVLWTPTFLMVGIAEEFMFRGYLQYTLASGLGRNGFQWAALILSLGFGAVHFHNAGETTFGLIQVVVFGLFACVLLKMTGSLWFGIGFHAAWDWGQSFFYGVPDSGMLAWHPWLNSHFQGPTWLTGGAAGPEGSVFTLLVLIASAALVVWYYRGKALATPS